MWKYEETGNIGFFPWRKNQFKHMLMKFFNTDLDVQTMRDTPKPLINLT